jgi:hypothetical protein
MTKILPSFYLPNLKPGIEAGESGLVPWGKANWPQYCGKRLLGIICFGGKIIRKKKKGERGGPNLCPFFHLLTALNVLKINN